MSPLHRAMMESPLGRINEQMKQISEMVRPTRAPNLEALSRSLAVPNKAAQHSYESAEVLVKTVAATIDAWERQVPEDVQAAVLAILSNGATIEVRTLSAQGHNGILIAGMWNGNPCVLISHQAGVQFLCVALKVEKGEKYKIGFQFNADEGSAESQ